MAVPTREAVEEAAEEVIRHGRTVLTKREVELAMRRASPLDFLRFIFTMLVIYTLLQSYGVSISMVVQALKGVRVLPAVIMSAAPYIHMFYVHYLLISTCMSMIRLRRPLPELVYFLDAVVHVLCSLVSFLYSGSITFLFFTLMAFVQIYFIAYYRRLKASFTDIMVRAVEMGISLPGELLTVEEAQALGLPQDLVRRLFLAREVEEKSRRGEQP